MKILHICLAGLFMDGWGYQDNMIAKYHVSFGYDVTVITNQWVFDENSNYVKTDKKQETDRWGVKIIRLPIKGDKPYTYKFKRYVGLYDSIVKIQPDIIFLHSSQIMDVDDIVRYKKEKPQVKLYVDNHCDYSNSATNWLSKYILHGIIWKRSTQKLNPYTVKFYGVLPARVDFLIERYKLKPERVELLEMGADDELVELADKQQGKLDTRKKLGYENDDFLLITGGKIDHAKRQTLLLMKALKEIKNTKLKLLIFGSVVEDMKDEFMELCDADERIQYIGWIASNDTYPYFAAADLAIFPGRHSVMWEQVAGQGIPMICKYWDGTTHVDVGGNVIFLHEDSKEEIKKVVESLMDKGKEYQEMLQVAQQVAKKRFSYNEIAKRAINNTGR